VSANKVPRRIFGPKREKDRETGENCIMGNFIICILHQIF
jgi:hypothetical protein